MTTIFSEEQEKRIVEFFMNLDTKFGIGVDKAGKTIYRKIKKDDPWFPPSLEELLPLASDVLSEDSKKIRLLNPLLQYYSYALYSVEKSKEVIAETLKKLSEKYDMDKLPVIYAASLKPSRQAYPSWIEIQFEKTHPFNEEDYGQINFIEALLQLEKEKNIKINSFSILMIEPLDIVIKANISYKPKILKLSENKSEFLYNPETGDGQLRGKYFRLVDNTDYRKIFDACFEIRGKKLEKEKVIKILNLGKPTDSSIDMPEVFSVVAGDHNPRRKSVSDVHITSKINEITKDIRNKTGLKTNEFVNNRGNLTLTI